MTFYYIMRERLQMKIKDWLFVPLLLSAFVPGPDPLGCNPLINLLLLPFTFSEV